MYIYKYMYIWAFPMKGGFPKKRAPGEMLRDLTGFDDPVELFDALDSNERGEVGGTGRGRGTSWNILES